MTSTQIEKAKQVTETFARIPDKEIILYKFHLRVSSKLYRKLNCFYSRAVNNLPQCRLDLVLHFRKRIDISKEKTTTWRISDYPNDA